jgi:putative endonuclease
MRVIPGLTRDPASLFSDVMDKTSHVYIMADRRNGTLYTGVTTDIIKRISEHRDGLIPGFTRDYGLKTLVWFEALADIETAIAREKSIKRWRREWKLDLIETLNPDWRDLWPTLTGGDAGLPLPREKRGPGSSPG